MACTCGVDVHAHVVPAQFPRSLSDPAPRGWPSTVEAGACHRQVMIDGKNYRTVSDHCWSTSRRLADFQELGLALQVISPMPELLGYWLPAADGALLARYMNEQIATMVAESGGRLVGMGTVPLQDMDRALAELRHLKHSLGLVGVEVGSNVNGTVIGDLVFDPFFEACVDLDIPVFVHALRPAGMDRLVGPAPLQQILAYPTDVGLAAASVLTSGLLRRHPRLRIAFSHGGGTLASLLPRLRQSMSVFPAVADCLVQDPAEQVRSMYFDTLVFDGPMLRHLVNVFGATQLMVGTDYPFNFRDQTPMQRLEQSGLDAQVIDQLSHLNARRYFGITNH